MSRTNPSHAGWWGRRRHWRNSRNQEKKFLFLVYCWKKRPKANKVIMESQDSVATVTFDQVKVCTVTDDGSSPVNKYPGLVGLKAEYDPEVSRDFQCKYISSLETPLFSGNDCAILRSNKWSLAAGFLSDKNGRKLPRWKPRHCFPLRRRNHHGLFSRSITSP